MAAPERDVVLQQAMLHLSMIGGLLVFVALGYSRPGEPPRQTDV
jgi:hypothetical protein